MGTLRSLVFQLLGSQAGAATQQQCTFLLVAKDIASFHFVFANAPGGNSLNYRNLSAHGRLELQSLVHQVRIEVGEVGEVGEVAWAFSCPLNVALPNLEEYIQTIVQQYVNTVLQSQKNQARAFLVRQYQCRK